MLCGNRKRSYGKVDQANDAKACSTAAFASTAMSYEDGLENAAIVNTIPGAGIFPIAPAIHELPLEILDLILASDLSMHDLIKASQVCPSFRDAIHDSPALQERLFLKAAKARHGIPNLNPLVLEHRPPPLDDLRCILTTWCLYEAVGTRFEDMLLCNPPATNIFMEVEVYGRLSDETHYLYVERKDGIRVLDLVVALKSRDIPKSICVWPFITIEAPSDVAFPAPSQASGRKEELEHRARVLELSNEMEGLKGRIKVLEDQISRNLRTGHGRAHCARCSERERY